MPIYEKRDDAGAVVERSVTFLGTDLDAQLSHAAANTDSPWQLVDVSGEPAQAGPTPVFVEPSTPDTGVDTQVDDPGSDSAPPQVGAPAVVDTTTDTIEAAEPAAPETEE